MDMRFYWMKDRVKQKYFFVYSKPGIQNMGNHFTEHHRPHHRKEIFATYLYMANAILKTDNKVVQEWENAIITPIYMVSLTQNHRCVNVMRAYGHTNTITVT